MKLFVAFVALFAVATANPLFTWSLDDLTEAVENPLTNPNLRPLLEYALNQLLKAINNGFTVDSIVVPMPVDIGVPTAPSTWSLQELSEALQDPATEPSILPYLEEGLNELMTSLISGNNVNSVIVYLPVNIVPAPAENIPVSPPAPVSSPLVQIIVNVNGKQQQVSDVSMPVQVVDNRIPDDVLALLR